MNGLRNLDYIMFSIYHRHDGYYFMVALFMSGDVAVEAFCVQWKVFVNDCDSAIVGTLQSRKESCFRF